MVDRLFEYIALDPDIFLPSERDLPHEPDNAIRDLEMLLHSGHAILNLRDGEWQSALSRSECVSKTGREFLTLMSKTNRLLLVRPRLANWELGREDWYQEAVAVKDEEASLSVRAYIEAPPPESNGGGLPRTTASRAWAHINRNAHIQLARSVEGYTALMTDVAWRSRTIEIIDPYMDPKKSGYRDFVTALGEASRITSRFGRMQVRFHFRCTTNHSDSAPTTDTIEYWEHAIHKHWQRLLPKGKIKGVAVIWRSFPKEDPHDRFILTPNFMLRCSNGFDTGKAETMGVQFEGFDFVGGDSPHRTPDIVSKRYNWQASDNRERLLGHFEFDATG